MRFQDSFGLEFTNLRRSKALNMAELLFAIRTIYALVILNPDDAFLKSCRFLSSSKTEMARELQ
jgi:hypothetical protein